MNNYVIIAGSFLTHLPPSSSICGPVADWFESIQSQLLYFKTISFGFNLHSRVSHLLRLCLKLGVSLCRKGVYFSRPGDSQF